MKVKKLLHTRYRVNDLEKTIGFYKDVLGLREVKRHKSPRGSELVFLKAPEGDELIEICSYPASGPVQVQPDPDTSRVPGGEPGRVRTASRAARSEVFGWSHLAT